MHHTPYDYWKEKNSKWYYFDSQGKRIIKKAVAFSQTKWKDVYNLGFGDLLPNSEIDDMAISNNGDISKIFATIIDIVQDFTRVYPSAKVNFYGSTKRRTALYNRMIRTYYQAFSECFIITASVKTKNGTKEVPFDPSSSQLYLGFNIKRIN
jgi:hypothetical protein